MVGAVGVAGAAVTFIKSWSPSARAKLAGAPVSADIAGLKEGQQLTIAWRGQPVSVSYTHLDVYKRQGCVGARHP